MEIRHLQYFMEVYRQKSFSTAAERLFMSQQGVSMAIYRLEEELSCKLFTRSNRRLELTEQGEFLREQAEEILRRVEICDEYFQRERDERRQTRELKIVSAYGAMPEFAGELVARFQTEHPDVWIGVQELKDVDCDDSVWNGTAELGFGVLPVDQAQFRVVPLFTHHVCVLVHEDHPLANEKMVSVDILRTTPIMVVDQQFKIHEIVKNCCRQKGFEPRISYYAGERMAISRMVSANHGVGVTVDSLARELEPTNVRIIPFDDPKMVWEVCLMEKRDKLQSNVAKQFVRFVTREMAAAQKKSPEKT